MKHVCLLLIFVMVLALPAHAAELALFEGATLARFLEAELPEGVAVDFEAATEDSPDMLRVHGISRAPVSVPLFRVAVDGQASGIDYLATGTLRAEDARAPAYLELWCQMPGSSQYFSRALDTPLTGSTRWSQHSAPFYLEAEQRADFITLGVRLEGPGTLYIQRLALDTMEGGLMGFVQRPGALSGILGGLIGVLGGVWGTLAGILAPKGRSRGIVLAMGYGMLSFGVFLALSGVILLFTGTPYHVWYALLLPGCILSIVMTPLLPLVRNRYREAEERLMRQVDAGEAL
jgi:hypothetical protein